MEHLKAPAARLGSLRFLSTDDLLRLVDELRGDLDRREVLRGAAEKGPPEAVAVVERFLRSVGIGAR